MELIECLQLDPEILGGVLRTFLIQFSIQEPILATKCQVNKHWCIWAQVRALPSSRLIRIFLPFRN
jgi:hypothetical protein